MKSGRAFGWTRHSSSSSPGCGHFKNFYRLGSREPNRYTADPFAVPKNAHILS